MFKDAHHIIHENREWSLRPEAKSIRETPSLIVKIDREEHNELHRTCPAIPLLGYHALIRTRKTFEVGDNPIQSMENLMRSIEEASNHPRAHEVEKHLAELAIWAIDLQRPFVSAALGQKQLII